MTMFVNRFHSVIFDKLTADSHPPNMFTEVRRESKVSGTLGGELKVSGTFSERLAISVSLAMS